MAGYTKLFSSIVHSTIWRAPDHVRLVWVTMLAMSDKNGLVESSVPGLADAARVSLDECEAALEHLSKPDEYSRSKQFDGRRIQEADGGWELLNYVKYRGKLKSDTIREQARLRQQKFREKNSVTVTHNANVTHCNAQSDPSPDPSPESDPDPKNKKPPISPLRGGYTKAFEEFWAIYPKKFGKMAAFRAWKRVWPLTFSLDEFLIIVHRHIESPQWKQNNGQYIPNPATWLNQGRWEDEIDTSQAAQAPRYEKLTAAEQAQQRSNEVLMREMEKIRMEQ